MGLLEGISMSERSPKAVWHNSSVYSFYSSTRPGRTHQVIVAPGEDIQCTCEGFGAHQHCWHVDWVNQYG